MSGNTRNQPCPCGSGKKYKKCCFSSEGPQRDSSLVNLPKPSSFLTVQTLFSKKKYLDIKKDFQIAAPRRARFDVDDFDFCLKEHNGKIYFLGQEEQAWNDYQVSLCIKKNGEILSGFQNSEDAICLLHQVIHYQGDTFLPYSAIKDTLQCLFLPTAQKEIYLEALTLFHSDFELYGDSKTRLFRLQEEDSLAPVSLPLYFDAHDHRETSKLRDCPQMENLYFLFSDGTALSFDELIFHPYRLLCKDRFLEVKKAYLNPEGSSRDYSNVKWEEGWYPSSRDGFSRLFRCVDQLIPSFDIFLSESRDLDLRIDPNQKIEEILAPLEDQNVSVNLVPNSSPGALAIHFETNDIFSGSPGFNWNPKSKVLKLEPSTNFVDKMRFSLARFGSTNLCKAGDKTQLVVNRHPDPVAVIKALKKQGCLVKELLPPLTYAKPHLAINLKSNNWNQIEIDTLFDTNQQKGIKLGQLSDAEFGVLESFQNGLCGFWDTEAKQIATRNPKFRSGELRLYKHAGLARILTSEYLRVSKELTVNEDRSSKLLKKIKEQLEPKISMLIYKILFKKGLGSPSSYSDLQKYVSKKFLENLNKFVSGLFKLPDESRVYLTDSQCIEVQTGEESLTLIDFVLQQLVNHASNNELLRSTSKGYNLTQTHYRDQFAPKDSKLARLKIELPKAVSPFSAGRLGSVFVDGFPIETLNKKDLSSELKIQNGTQLDWFELHPSYFFKGQEISMETAKQFLQGEVVEFKGHFYQVDPKEIPSMKSLERFWNRITATKSKAVSFSEASSVEMKIERSQILELLALKRQGVSVIGNKRWREISKSFERLDTGFESRENNLEGRLRDFKGQLKPFQKEGLYWLSTMYDLGLGGILSDDMGLGKTVQSIALIHCLLKSESTREKIPHLIVVPTSLTYNWSQEFQKFSPKTKVCIFEGKSKPQYLEDWTQSSPDVVIVTYGLLLEHKDFFVSHDWGVAFFDEAQNLKNIKALRRQAAKELSCKNKIALTGTPIENHYGELFSILDLCVQGCLGSYQLFMQTFGNMAKGGHDAISLVEDFAFLKEKVKPLVLRRTKDMVLDDLPEKTESVIPLQFDKKQEEIYKKTALSWNSQIQHLVKEKGESGAQLQMLTALLRLRQICSCPQAIEGVAKNIESPKFRVIVEKVVELTEIRESVILFTNFVSTLDLLTKELEEAGVKTLTLCGRDSKGKREKTLKEFNESKDSCALLMTLKTGGVGLNLTKANYVFHLEPWWNPAAENQGTDRVHRIGQKRSVHVYRYIMKNSVEEKIQDLKSLKQRAFDMMFQEDLAEVEKSASLGKNRLTQKDFEVLLS